MIIKIDTIQKTVIVEGVVNIQEFITEIRKLLGDDYENYSIASIVYYNTETYTSPYLWEVPPFMCRTSYAANIHNVR